MTPAGGAAGREADAAPTPTPACPKRKRGARGGRGRGRTRVTAALAAAPTGLLNSLENQARCVLQLVAVVKSLRLGDKTDPSAKKARPRSQGEGGEPGRKAQNAATPTQKRRARRKRAAAAAERTAAAPCNAPGAAHDAGDVAATPPRGQRDNQDVVSSMATEAAPTSSEQVPKNVHGRPEHDVRLSPVAKRTLMSAGPRQRPKTVNDLRWR